MSATPSPTVSVPEGTRGVVLLWVDNQGNPAVGYVEPTECVPLPRRQTATMLAALADQLRRQADSLDYLAEEET